MCRVDCTRLRCIFSQSKVPGRKRARILRARHAAAAVSSPSAMEENKMWCARQKWYGIVAIMTIGLALSACGDGDSTGPEPTFDNPSTVRVVNQLFGPVIYFRARPCGTSDWGPDLFDTDDPVEGTLQPGQSRDFTVEAGCYDFRAEYLETTEPGPLLEMMIFDQIASPITPVVWTLEEDPVDPS